jgi:hypothetical protein
MEEYNRMKKREQELQNPYLTGDKTPGLRKLTLNLGVALRK